MKLVSFRSASLVLAAASTLLSFAAPAFAADPVLNRLVLFANDRDANTAEVDLVTDSNGVAKGFAYVQHDLANKKSTRTVYTLAQTAKDPGAVLEASQGLNAVVLKGTIDVNKGGPMNFHWVSNGLTNVFKDCKVTLEKTATGWQFTNAYTNKKIVNGKIVTWAMGLTTLEGICPENEASN